jgi:hypothetical protein
MLSRVFFIGLSLLLLPSCSETRSPESTTRAFVTAIHARDLAKARNLLVAEEAEGQNLMLQPGTFDHGWRMGAVAVDGARAKVEVTPGRGSTVPLVLRREQGCWRVSLRDTAREMHGIDAAAMALVQEQARAVAMQMRAHANASSPDQMQEALRRVMDDAVVEMQRAMDEAARRRPSAPR